MAEAGSTSLAPSSPTLLVLVSDEISLSPLLVSRWLHDLPPDRQARMARWHDEAALHRSLLGTRLLRCGLQALGHGAGRPLASLRHAPGRRPTLDLPVVFNISHCAGRVLCAVSEAGPLGIDVEPVGALVADDFPTYLQPAERRWAGRDARRFCSIWTRKEAVAKAAGHRGLADLPLIDTRAADAGAVLRGIPWQTCPIPVGNDHVAHLACDIDRDLSACLTVVPVPGQALETDAPFQPA